MTLRPILRDASEDLPALARLAGRLEPEMRRQFLAAIRETQGSIELEALAEAIQAGNMGEIEIAAGLDQINDKLNGMRAVLQRGFLIGATYAWEGLEASGLNMAFDLVNPAAVMWAQSVGAARITEIGTETMLGIREYLERTMAGQFDAGDLARAVREMVGLHSRQMNAVENFRLALELDGTLTDAQVDARVLKYTNAQLRLRANTIARTETMTATADGQRGMWNEAKKQGLITERTRRVWIISPHEGVCVDCEGFAGQLAELHGMYHKKPGPGGVEEISGMPLHPNCQCCEALTTI